MKNLLEKFDNLTSGTRTLIAVVVALAFFIPYSYFTQPSPQERAKAEAERIARLEAQNAQNTQNAAPSADSITNTPQTPQSTNLSNAPQSPANSTSNDILAVIESPDFRYEIDKFGRIFQVYLKSEKFKKKEEGSEEKTNLALFDKNLKAGEPRVLEVRFADPNLNQKAFSNHYTSNINYLELPSLSEFSANDAMKNNEIVLRQNLGNAPNSQDSEIILEKRIKFAPDGSYEVFINLPQNISYFLSTGMRPSAESDSYVINGVIIKKVDDKIEMIEDEDLKAQANFANARFIAAVDRYYTSLLYPLGDERLNINILPTNEQNPQAFVALNGQAHLGGYLGPKDYHLLKSINENLTDVVEYGVITFFAKPLFLLLSWLFSLVGNWGWAIVLLTLLVRVVLYPLTYKGMVSMQKLKDIAPKMKELQERYKGEPQKLQMHMMELYKKHGANPMGGCLPILLQMPVFFAIYRVLYNAIELKGAEWILWLNDLSVMDPFFVLPILMGASMYLQQHLTPTSFTDPMQAKVFKFLPLVFTLFFITFPAGLVLYWLTNNIFSIIQQLAINKMLEAKKAREIAEHHKK